MATLGHEHEYQVTREHQVTHGDPGHGVRIHMYNIQTPLHQINVHKVWLLFLSLTLPPHPLIIIIL